MKIRASILCLCSLSMGAPLAWADASSKSLKIAELMQITGARQVLHELDAKADQEEAARAWGRFYSEHVSESDLDAILAYYRSPAGQKDVSASRAALGEVQKYLAKERVPTVSRTGTAAVVGPAASGTSTTAGIGSAANVTGTAAGVRSGASGTGTAHGAGSAASGGTGAAGHVGSTTNDAAAGAVTAGAVGPTSTAPPPAPQRPWSSAPRAPDGLVVPSPSLPEQCEGPPAPVPAPGSHAVPSSGRSVVCVCTNDKGTLTRDPVIAESSGDARVDSGAIKMARVDSGRYIPPTVDGQPQSACFRFAIDFSRHP